MVWHEEGWDPPCGIAQDTLHEDDNHCSVYTGADFVWNKAIRAEVKSMRLMDQNCYVPETTSL